MEPKKYLNIHISTLTILKVIFILIAFYFLYLVKDILAIMFVSLVLASALSPSVDWMQRRRIPRPLGIVFIYLTLLIIISSAVYLIIPPIIEQINDLSKNFPYYFEKIMERLIGFRDYALEYGFLDNIKTGLNAVSANLQTAAGGVFSTVTGIFGSIISFFLVLVFTFYMLAEKDAMRKIVWSVAPIQHQPYIMQLISRMQVKIGLWLRGQLILSLIIFILIFTGLKILGVKYALTLALIAGLTEFVPYLGPILAAIPAIFLSLTQSPMLALFVAVLYYIVQLVENNIIVPKVMQKVVGLNPIVSITVLLIGFKVAGVVGAVLSIPVATALSVFVMDIFERRGQRA
ncbi:hypothetical protein COV49_02690 [Candidatus Falkowbacteria bacterium CG11_big_fil_rev_8_21_14_0_20_39_10]|uniref:AI-2E family transporter n=1 Tax=Candidatus Falkowbacteria bacterium CG11_big_fil_rev_8_21_14_0_20_39_10 TaxID=1974570 RepID=A0A2M6K943_9BACT|nr:MAG: hypothetical protein COV49_02690 [Candidatus Falkowbacteria bacterium CG11_big_fil_rev_8_21_14_0_20_39_10]